MIYELNGLGRISQEYNYCELYADSVISGIDNHDSLKLLKDITKNENWIYTVTERYTGGGGSYECHFVIKNKDIE